MQTETGERCQMQEESCTADCLNGLSPITLNGLMDLFIIIINQYCKETDQSADLLHQRCQSRRKTLVKTSDPTEGATLNVYQININPSWGISNIH